MTKIRLKKKLGSSTGVKPTVSALALRVKTSVTHKGNETLSKDDRWELGKFKFKSEG